jgi:hypothetical protein
VSTCGVCSFGGGGGSRGGGTFWDLIWFPMWCGLLLGRSAVSAEVDEPCEGGGSGAFTGLFLDEPKTLLKNPGRSLDG